MAVKNKNIAGILALTLGPLGMHRFYLEQYALGALYIFLPFISVFLSIIDAIKFFAMSQDAFDLKYNPDYSWEYDEPAKKQYFEDEEYNFRKAKRQHVFQNRKEADLFTLYNQKGIQSFKAYEYEAALYSFLKALAVYDKDAQLHFNLSCVYSVSENTEKSIIYLNKAMEFGYKNYDLIFEHKALAFLRLQPEFDAFIENGYKIVEKESVIDEMDILDQLQKLGELKERGLLTEEEFVVQKKKLLD